MKSVSAVWGKFSHWASTHPKASIAIIVGMVFVGGGALAVGIFYPSPQTLVSDIVDKINPTPEEPVQKHYSPLTGVEVADKATTTTQVRAIMIENSPSSRPQSGIKQAGIIYEAVAEGGITRLLTLHQESRAELIGPVRSLRPYYVEWLAPFDATVSHVGGSANALKEIRNGSYKDVDQFFNGSYYWRATDRPAPHNVYTSSDKLFEMNNAKGYTGSTFPAWPRKLDAPATKPTATKVDITVSSPLYNVHYDYDAGTNSYTRSIGGALHMDREQGQIAPKTVVAIKVPTSRGFEDGYREQMETSGHNTAYIFQDGIAIEGIWQKTDKRAQMRFYDKLGKPIAFNAGQTWVTVIGPDKAVSWQ